MIRTSSSSGIWRRSNTHPTELDWRCAPRDCEPDATVAAVVRLARSYTPIGAIASFGHTSGREQLARKRPCSRRQGFLVTLPRCGAGLRGWAGFAFAVRSPVDALRLDARGGGMWITERPRFLPLPGVPLRVDSEPDCTQL